MKLISFRAWQRTEVTISWGIVLNGVFMEVAKSLNDGAKWRLRVILCTALILIVSVGCLTATGNSLPLYQMQSQDLPVLLLLGAAVFVTTLKTPALKLPAHLPPWWALLVGGFAVAWLVVLGARLIFENYPLSRDEHMVVFDMAIYNSGRLAQPLAPFWRPYAGALVPDFLINEKMPVGLVSGYLPVNAMLRLGFSKFADPVWFNPLLAIAGGWALLDIARREFGRDDRACWVVLLVYGLSTQMLVTAMTPFSVTAHMALNLIWLAMFLRGGKIGHAAAISIGFLVIGLHQLVFHPVFVAPFLLWRLYQRQWRLVFVYGAAYLVMLAWWAAYPLLLSVQSAPGASSMGETHQNFLTERLLPLLTHRTPGTIGLMIMNLLRFFAWQNLALLPLIVASVADARRLGGLAAAMLLGILLWLAILTLIMPYQGLGWGYRYMSPYLGSLALLAGFGYRELVRWSGGDRADGMVIVLSALTALIALPLLAVTTQSFVRPYLALERLVAAQRSTFVIIDTAVSNPQDESWALHPLDQVRNLPDLRGRPIRLSGNRVNSDMILRLCNIGSITMLARVDMRQVGFMPNVPVDSRRFETMRETVIDRLPHCVRPAIVDFNGV